MASHGYDAIVYTVKPLPKRLPGVAQLTPVQMPFYDQPGQADFARFEAVTSRLAGAGVQDLDRPAATITNSIHPQAVGWLVLAGLAALTAVAMVGQALARQASAALARHVARNQDNVIKPTVPAALVNFGASAAFPLLLGGVVAVCGLAALAHLLVVSVARRRTESGLLMALGMVRRQLAAIVFWQATTVAVVAIAAGIPLGIAAGRAIWRAFAISLGVVPVPVVQAWLIVALAAGALLAANALAAVPAMSAARSRPGPLLRTE